MSWEKKLTELCLYDLWHAEWCADHFCGSHIYRSHPRTCCALAALSKYLFSIQKEGRLELMVPSKCGAYGMLRYVTATILEFDFDSNFASL